MKPGGQVGVFKHQVALEIPGGQIKPGGDVKVESSIYGGVLVFDVNAGNKVFNGFPLHRKGFEGNIPCNLWIFKGSGGRQISKKDAVGGAFFPDDVKSGKGDAIGIEFNVKLVTGIGPSRCMDFPIFSQVNVQVFQKDFLKIKTGDEIYSFHRFSSHFNAFACQGYQGFGEVFAAIYVGLKGKNSFKALIFQGTDVRGQVFQGHGA